MNKELIDTRLVAKLMNQTAKECGMVRVYSCTDSVWWSRLGELEKRGAIHPSYNYRRLAKCYNFLDDRFVGELTKKVKAEGFDLADCWFTAKTRKSLVYDYNSPKYKKESKYYFDNWKQEKAKGKSMPEPRIIPNTENAVYVRMIARFKNKHYWVKSINPDSKEVTELVVYPMPKLARVVNKFIEGEHWEDINEKCSFELTRMQTGKKAIYTYEEWLKFVDDYK